MIRTERGEHIATCESCGQEEPGGCAEFADFIADLKAEG